MDNKLKEQLIKIKLGKDIAYYIVLSDFNNENILFDKLAEILFKNNCIVILDRGTVSDRYFIEAGEKIKQLCAEFDGTLIVFSRADLAFILEADGVLLNENSISQAQAQSISGHNTLIGFCTNKNINDTDFCVSDKKLCTSCTDKYINIKELK